MTKDNLLNEGFHRQQAEAKQGRYGMGKQGQKEFAGMPERSELGRKAVEYMNQLDRIEGLKNTAENTRCDLVKLFKKYEKTRILVEGRTVSYAHTESDKISIKQKLDKNKEK